MSRPRGYAAWNPQSGTRLLLDAISGVLDEYQNNLPLTLRQVFYRLVGTDQLSKTERYYNRLCETMNRARRGGFIDWDAIPKQANQDVESRLYGDKEKPMNTLKLNANVNATAHHEAGHFIANSANHKQRVRDLVSAFAPELPHP